MQAQELSQADQNFQQRSEDRFFDNSIMMFATFLFVMLMFGAMGEVEAKVCGVPPVCQCWTNARLLQCSNVEELPRFGYIEQRFYKVLYITGSMDRAPDLSGWHNMRTVNVQQTTISCSIIQAWRQSASYRVKAERCPNRTGIYLYI